MEPWASLSSRWSCCTSTFGRLYGLLVERGIHPTQSQINRGREFVLRAEQHGLRQVNPPPLMRDVIRQFEAAHVYAFQLTFVLMGWWPSSAPLFAGCWSVGATTR